VKKPDRQQVYQAGSFLLCVFLALQITDGLEGTEFSGGWLTWVHTVEPCKSRRGSYRRVSRAHSREDCNIQLTFQNWETRLLRIVVWMRAKTASLFGISALLVLLVLPAVDFPETKFDEANTPTNEMVQSASLVCVSLSKIPTHRDRQGLAVDSPKLFATNKSACSLSSSERITSPTLPSLAACVLRC
jgi:hypothetical protein